MYVSSEQAVAAEADVRPDHHRDRDTRDDPDEQRGRIEAHAAAAPGASRTGEGDRVRAGGDAAADVVVLLRVDEVLRPRVAHTCAETDGHVSTSGACTAGRTGRWARAGRRCTRAGTAPCRSYRRSRRPRCACPGPRG